MPGCPYRNRNLFETHHLTPFAGLREPGLKVSAGAKRSGLFWALRKGHPLTPTDLEEMRLLYEWRTGEEIQKAPTLAPPNCKVVLAHWRALSKVFIANSSPGVVDRVRIVAPPEADKESDEGEAKPETAEHISPVHSSLVQMDEEPIL